MSSGGPDNLEAMTPITPECSRVVRPDEREELFIALGQSCANGLGNHRRGNSATKLSQIHIGANHADMIERMRIAGKRLDILKSHYLPLRANCHVEDPSLGKVLNEGNLLLQSERRVQCCPASSQNNRVQNSKDPLGILQPDIANQHALEL